MLKLRLIVKSFREYVGALVVSVAVSRLQLIFVPVKDFVEPFDRRVVSAVQVSHFFGFARRDNLKRRLVILSEF